MRKLLRKYWYAAAALLLALIAMAINPPTGEMVVSWDWGACFLLTALSWAFTGMERQHLFDALSRNLPYFRKSWFLLLVLDILGYLLGALVTGLGAVLVLCPIAAHILHGKERDRFVPGALAMITLAAVSGSMLLPTGSPANLLLSFHGADAFTKLWPYSLCGLAVSILYIAVILKGKLGDTLYLPPAEEVPILGNQGLKMLYVCLAFTVVLSAYGMLFWLNCFVLVAVILIMFDRPVFKKADYSLPLTLLFLSIAGTSLGLGTESLMLGTALTELLGSTAIAPLLLPGTDPVLLLKAVNLGSLPLFSSIPALLSLRTADDKKTFCKAYAMAALPAFLLMCVLATFL